MAKHFYPFRQAGLAVYFFSIPEAEKRRSDLQKDLESRLNQREIMLHSYKDELFGIIGLAHLQELPTLTDLVMRSLNQFNATYFLGVSGHHRKPTEFGVAMREAFQCCRIGAYQQQAVVIFGQEPFF